MWNFYIFTKTISWWKYIRQIIKRLQFSLNFKTEFVFDFIRYFSIWSFTCYLWWKFSFVKIFCWFVVITRFFRSVVTEEYFFFFKIPPFSINFPCQDKIFNFQFFHECVKVLVLQTKGIYKSYTTLNNWTTLFINLGDEYKFTFSNFLLTWLGKE